MSPITVIPTALAMSAAAARNPRNAGTCDLFYIAGKLGQAHRRAEYLTRTLNALIEHEGFPAPLPEVRAGVVLKSATRNSRWTLAAVDAWFDDRLPPSIRGILGQGERAELDSRLSARASNLFSGDAA